MSPDWSPAVDQCGMDCKAACLLPGVRQPFLSPLPCERFSVEMLATCAVGSLF